MKIPSSITNTLIIFILLGTSIISWHKIYIQSVGSQQEGQQFNGERANQDVDFQVSLGPRIPGTEAHNQIIEWINTELEQTGWEVEIQLGEILGQKVTNILGKRGGERDQGQPWIILGAHYDTRIYSDKDPNPEKRNLPVPGANDGASGVAVLLELARTLPKNLDQEIWLVFFDTEDNGNIAGWDWILGSRFFVQSLHEKPDAVIIVDMIGDADLNIYMEQSSDPAISSEIWAVAGELGFSQFIPILKYRLLDDHVPFLESGIRAVDIIDFDYPYWHTTDDTTDKVSAKSLEAVGETLRTWLLRANT
jgi:glutaminyl-peptide cyclotransferase